MANNSGAKKGNSKKAIATLLPIEIARMLARMFLLTRVAAIQSALANSPSPRRQIWRFLRVDR